MHRKYSEGKGRCEGSMGNIGRGDVYYADLSPAVDSEQGGRRPVVVIQNNKGNRFSPTVIVACITSSATKAKLPTHVAIEGEFGIGDGSIVLAEQIRTISKNRLENRVTTLGRDTMAMIDDALGISMAIKLKNK